jgi:transposase
MKMFVDSPAIFLHRDSVDFRKSINGLSLIVEHELGLDAMNSALYLFVNRAKTKIKILYWDVTGFALWYKRLERNRFKWPSKNSSELLELSNNQLEWLLTGYDIIGHAPFILHAEKNN